MSEEQKQQCEHLWVRRRDGSWCAYCGEPRFGMELTEEERQRLYLHTLSGEKAK